MARPPDMNRLRAEDFKEDDRELIGKIGGGLNNFMDQTIYALNGNINFENLNQELKSVDISIDGSGALINPPSIKIGVTGRVEGIVCIQAINLNNDGTYPTSYPFISFTIGTDSLIKLLNITGLPNNSSYRLKLLIIGT